MSVVVAALSSVLTSSFLSLFFAWVERRLTTASPPPAAPLAALAAAAADFAGSGEPGSSSLEHEELARSDETWRLRFLVSSSQSFSPGKERIYLFSDQILMTLSDDDDEDMI